MREHRSRVRSLSLQTSGYQLRPCNSYVTAVPPSGGAARGHFWPCGGCDWVTVHPREVIQGPRTLYHVAVSPSCLHGPPRPAGAWGKAHPLLSHLDYEVPSMSL